MLQGVPLVPLWSGEIAKFGTVESSSHIYVVTSTEDLDMFIKVKNSIVSPYIPVELNKKLSNPFLGQNTNLKVMNLVFLANLLRSLLPLAWEVKYICKVIYLYLF